MNRLIVAFLAALDAVLAAAGGLAAALAPLTLLWIFGFTGAADWGALWPASAMLWQLGHLVPVAITLPETYLAAAGIDADAAAFTISLAPLALAAFTAIFAARSGRRAAAAGAPIAGAVTGALVFAAVTALVALTSSAPVASVTLWQAILFPAAVFAAPALLGAAVGAWVHDAPPVDRLRARVDGLGGAWPSIPGLIVRGTAIALAGLVAVGGVVLFVAVVLRGGQVVALFQSGNVDVAGATVLALGQLAYLPTLVLWALGFAAGPGFVLGAGGAVSPAGTQLGVVPGIPILGAVPDSTSTWMLLLVLLPVGVGALTGWMLRSLLVRDAGGAEAEAVAPRVALLGGVTVLVGAITALAAVCASGSIGPGRLAEVGLQPGPTSLALALEVAVGAGILLLAPRRASDREPEVEPVDERVAVLTGVGLQTRAAEAFDAEEKTAEPPRAWAGIPHLGAAWRDEVPPEATAERLDDPAPTAADDADTGPIEVAPDQATEPIPGFERGSDGRGPAGRDPDAPVD